MIARRFFPFLIILGSCFGIPPAAFCQLAPADAFEPVNQLAVYLGTTEERLQAIYLVDQARHNYRPGTSAHPFTLKASFTSTGQTSFEGDGTFEETVTGANYHMVAKLGGSTIVRVMSGGRALGNTPNDPLPLRLQLIWASLFFPIGHDNNGTLRTASVNYEGQNLTCVLHSGSVPRTPSLRYFQETEACIDPERGLLRVWSEKPGIYAEYDYNGELNFHGNVVARQITVTEAGVQTVVIRVESLQDPSEMELASVKPEPGLQPTFGLGGLDTFPIRAARIPGISPGARVIVHASIGANDGRVIEAEALQMEDAQLAEAAVQLVKSQRFAPTGLQREAFINVMFDLPAASPNNQHVER
jgi:hypothetical protein